MITQSNAIPITQDGNGVRPSQLYLIFRQDQSFFGLNLSSIREVLPWGELSVTAVPNTEQSVLGLFNLRGEILPVMDFGVITGNTPTDTHTESCRVMIVERPHDRTGQSKSESKSVGYGLLISQVITVSELWLDEIASVHEVGSTLTPILQGLYEWQDHLLMLLEGDAITKTFKPN